jgi:metal-responsive CopG/Arc/MetJ family transcriptional regulator
MKDTSKLNRLIRSRHKPERNSRIHTIAEHIISKRNPQKQKGLRGTRQKIQDNEDSIQETTSFETILEKEATIYDKLRGKRSNISMLRRRMMYWRLFRSYGLTIQMIACLLDVSQPTARKRVGEAYLHLKTARQRPEPSVLKLC